MKTTRSPSRKCRFLRFTAASAALALSACSNGPSQSDIEKAMRQEVAQGMASGISGYMPKIHDIKKLDCKQNSGVVYQCSVELNVTPPGGKRQKAVTQMNFAKGSDGWVMTR